ncbi:hypothetical protein MUP32_01445, partial [Candidatus Microgenomates bacterium]|nr:hypothetical protein [Candidatus Microgenomates bacterium]
VKAARLIIVQSAPAITDTQTQIEVGDVGSTKSVTYVPLLRPKYYYWDKDRYSGQVSIYFEATLVNVGLESYTYAGLSSNSCSSIVANSTLLVQGTTYDRFRSQAITLTDNTAYEVCIMSDDGSAASIINAKIIVEQTSYGRGLTDIEMVHHYVNTLDTETSNTYVERNFDNEFNPSNFSATGATFNYYFEATAKVSALPDSTAFIKLKDVDNTDEIDNPTSSELSGLNTSYARLRSSAIGGNTDWPSAAADLDTIMKETSTYTLSVSSSSLIIQASGLPGAVKVDDAGNWGSSAGASRAVTRTKSGDLYAFGDSGDDCEIWKSIDNGQTWLQKDTINSLDCSGATGAVASAYDSNNTIHLLYTKEVTGAPRTFYNTFNTGTDAFGSEFDLTMSYANDYDIAVDSNNIPHIVATSGFGQTTYYRNKVGGSWNTTVELETSILPSMSSIVINEDNIPELSYINSTDDILTAAVGADNNPIVDEWTLYNVDTDVDNSTGRYGSSIAIDSAGNTWIAYMDDTNANGVSTDDEVSLVHHHDGDAWTSWQAAIDNNNVGYEPSIAVLDQDIYVFYQDDNNHIVYDIYQSGIASPAWGGEKVLERSIGGKSYQDVKAKYSSLNNFYGPKIDFLFSDGTDVYWDQLDVAGKIKDSSGDGPLKGQGRQVVRSSNGDLYAIIAPSAALKIYKSTDGSSWTLMDSGNAPDCWDNVAVAIDSNDKLHIVCNDSSLPSLIIYETFVNGSYSNIDETIETSDTTDTFSSLSISIDNADAPHITYVFGDTSATDTMVRYRNKTSGSWQTLRTVETDTSTATGFIASTITINESNIPEIAYVDSTNNDLIAAVGNDNNAATFTLKEAVDADVNDTTDQRGTSIAIDSSGNTWIAYIDDTNNYVALAKNTGNWDTGWTTVTSKTDVGYEPSIAIDGTDIYVFYEDDNDDIVYDKYSSGAVSPSWSGETVLESGTFQDVKVKWSYYQNRGSNGTNYSGISGIPEFDYLFSDGTDVFYNYFKPPSAAAATGSQDEIATGISTGLTNTISTVVDPTNSKIHLTYVDGSGHIVYDQYTSDWSFSAATLDSNTGNGYPTLTVDSSNNNLYAFWIRGDDIFYKKGTHSAGSWSWSADPISWQATGTNIYCTSNFTASASIFVLWSNGSGTSYNIEWAKITTNTGPSAPTLLFVNMSTYTAQSGVANPIAVGDSRPVFSSIYNDPDEVDYATKYEIIVYSVTGCLSGQVWDSGTDGTIIDTCTKGNRCADVAYGDTSPLDFDGTKYYWKMRYWDDDETAGEFSDCSDNFTILGPADQMRHGNFFFNETSKEFFTW